MRYFVEGLMSITSTTVNGCSSDWKYVSSCSTPFSNSLKSLFLRPGMNRLLRSSTETGVLTRFVSTVISSSSLGLADCGLGAVTNRSCGLMIESLITGGRVAFGFAGSSFFTSGGATTRGRDFPPDCPKIDTLAAKTANNTQIALFLIPEKLLQTRERDSDCLVVNSSIVL